MNSSVHPDHAEPVPSAEGDSETAATRAARDRAYRRLAVAILALDVPTVAAQLSRGHTP